MENNQRHVIKGTFLLTAILFGAPVLAKTDIKAKQQQLQENIGASKTNLEQYENNLRTVVTNLAETERALKTIERQKVAIGKQTGDSAKDQKNVDAARAEVEGQLKAERDKMAAEDKQIEELKAALQRLEANRAKRQINVTTYEERLQKVDGEKAAWGERSQSIVDLEQALRAKEDEAKAERKRLQAKKAEYEEEIAKWKKQIRIAERSSANFGRLKDD